ncbi:MAG TPA: ATP-binding protein [Ignavibacteria bacterium]
MGKEKIHPEINTPGSASEVKIHKENSTFLISSLLILALIGIFLFVIFSYRDQKERFTESVQNDIKTITDLKTLQIESWRKERLDNGRIISENKLLSDKIRNYHENNTLETEADISLWLKSLLQNPDYKSAQIVDISGNPILSEPRKSNKPGEQILKYIGETVKDRNSELTNFHFYNDTATVQIALVIPLITSADTDIREVLILEINPFNFLYPLIQTWPNESKTAVCLLVKKEGESVLYLIPPKDIEKSALKYEINTKENELLPVKAIKGITGITTGLNNKQKPVIGVIKPVPGTNWYLIAEIENDELYAQIKQVTIFLVILISLLIMIVGSIILYLWNRQKISYYRSLYLSELKREAIKKHFEYTLKYANDIIILSDKTGQIVEANERAVSVYGYTREELLKLNLKDLRHPGTRKDFEATYNRIHEEGGFLFETLHIKKDGTEIPVEVSSREIIADGHAFYHGIIRDISERKRAEEEMRNAKEKAEEISRLKSSFLANMSHELRTPMSGILGFAEILNNELVDPGYKEMAGIILKGGKRLTNTLNSILDLSKVEADKMELNFECVNLSEAVSETARLFEASVKEKGLTLKTEIEQNIYSKIDLRILDHALSNLIQNSIVYTEKGSITISLNREMINDKDCAVLKVTDTGIGIPANYVDAIFEPFRQVSDGLSRKYEGTGLGLTLTKKFVEIMNGEISVESKFGVGSTFTVLFAATAESEKEVEKINMGKRDTETLPKQNSKKILLVEDDDLTLTTVRVILKNYCIIDSVSTGYEAIEMAKKNSYDVILMDIGLKGMNGLEATQEIKKLKGYEKTPIVAVTAYAMAGDKEKFLEGGCTHYISKPFKIKEFVETIQSLG